jgi:hypothetical protein
VERERPRSFVGLVISEGDIWRVRFGGSDGGLFDATLRDGCGVRWRCVLVEWVWKMRYSWLYVKTFLPRQVMTIDDDSLESSEMK